MTQKASFFSKSTLQKAIAPLFYALIIAFLAYYLKSIDLSKLKDIDFLPWAMIAATVFALLTRYWGAYIWFVLLHSLGARELKQNRVKLVYVYAKSWMGRYVPGTAPWILGKIYFASKLGISKNKLAVSSILEAGLQIVVVLALSLFVLLLDSRFDVVTPGVKILMTALLFTCVISMIPIVFNKVMALAYKLLKRKTLPVDDMVTNATVVKGILLYAVGALLNGLSLFFIAKGVYPELPYDTLLFVMSVGNLAGALGMLAIFVPSGIGVREGVQLVLLSAIMPVEIALVITIVTRLWGVIADIAFYGLTLAHLKLSK